MLHASYLRRDIGRGIGLLELLTHYYSRIDSHLEHRFCFLLSILYGRYTTGRSYKRSGHDKTIQLGEHRLGEVDTGRQDTRYTSFIYLQSMRTSYLYTIILSLPCMSVVIQKSQCYSSSEADRSIRCSSGSMMARSSWYGRPRCRPLIIMTQMTSLPKVLNLPQSDTFTVGYPRLSPTLALRTVSHHPYLLSTSIPTYYADVTSKRIANMLNAWKKVSTHTHSLSHRTRPVAHTGSCWSIIR